MAKKTVTKKRAVKVDAQGQAHIHSSFNNIIITLTNSEGQVISWSSAGKMGFRSSKKNTPALQDARGHMRHSLLCGGQGWDHISSSKSRSDGAYRAAAMRLE